jgi:hypothetical protein
MERPRRSLRVIVQKMRGEDRGAVTSSDVIKGAIELKLNLPSPPKVTG